MCNWSEYPTSDGSALSRKKSYLWYLHLEILLILYHVDVVFISILLSYPISIILALPIVPFSHGMGLKQEVRFI